MGPDAERIPKQTTNTVSNQIWDGLVRREGALRDQRKQVGGERRRAQRKGRKEYQWGCGGAGRGRGAVQAGHRCCRCCSRHRAPEAAPSGPPLAQTGCGISRVDGETP